MIIKKFTGKTEAEATEAAQKELGSGAVIMSVRQIKPKGLFAFLKPKLTEVTAAMEEESQRSAYVRKEAALSGSSASAGSPRGNVAPRSAAASDNTRSIEEKLENLQTLLEKQLQNRELSRQDGSQAGTEKQEADAEESRIGVT